MKKIGILLGMLLIAGVYAMADEAATLQDDLLFADVEAMALSQAEMEAVEGGLPIAIPLILATPVDEIVIAAGAVVVAKIIVEVKEYVSNMSSEHKKKGSTNPANREKHEKGQAAKDKGKKGGEKGDARRPGRR